MSLTLSQATANVRIDLNDTDPANYRWSDATIQRELDRALARYSQVAPLLLSAQIPTAASSRTYPTPTGAWWVEKVEYPVNLTSPYYPRRYVPFHIHAVTAAGGELELDIASPPADNTGTIEITYATKHTLDNTGTTVPEYHHDALYLGAAAFLVEQWLGNVNDNFEYVDGQFRDKVDDTKSIAAWQALSLTLTQRWDARLKAIETEVNQTASIGRWGDKPYRWDRL